MMALLPCGTWVAGRRSNVPCDYRSAIRAAQWCLVSIIPLPLRVRTEMLETSFRMHGDEVTRTLIGCPPTAERQK